MKYIIILVLLASCYNSKQAVKQTNKALLNYPAVVAKIARDAFPCITIKADTIITTVDTTIMVDCPPINDYINNIVHDTLVKYVAGASRYIQVPVTLPIRTVTVIKIIEDSAKIKILQSAVDIQNSTIIDNDKKINQKNKWLLYLSIFVAIVTGLSILKFIIKK